MAFLGATDDSELKKKKKSAFLQIPCELTKQKS